ncbi:MAG: alpha-L-fucosidase [Bryobacteraceae bacterium]
MQRRDFFKLIGVAATALPISAQARDVQPTSLQSGFDEYTEDYAKFCATPAAERVFYALRNGRVVSEKLNNQGWKPSPEYSPRDVKLPVPGGSHDSVPTISPIPGLAGQGPYKPAWDSLLQYECPEWYRDAKFGIWNHWSPQCVPEDGDWYARNMYRQGSGQNKFQVARYGPPSRFGYKDLCAQWTLLDWQPSELMDLYVKAGARFFVALANHHDGFDTWNSKHHPWNAVNLGPHRDVIGVWAAEARRRNLRFGVTVHQARNWWWFQTSHGADAAGPLAGKPYDGRLVLAEGRNQWWQDYDPQQLYAPKHPYDALPNVAYVRNFYDRTRDLVDQHNPDLLYFDDRLFPLGWGGMNIGAYFYNHSKRLNAGKVEGVINIKMVPPHLSKAVVADIERGIASSILPYPWQSETCIGQWHYLRALYNKPGEYGGYMHPAEVIHWLVDTVSKNGTFVLNIPGKPDGTIDSKERLVLEHIAAWFKVNGEAIYSTRPWRVYGEGPHMIKTGSFQGKSTKGLDARDVRFTRNKANTVIYAIVLGWPTEPIVVQALGTSAATKPGKIEHVELMGTQEKLDWSQDATSLRVKLPANYHPRSDYAAALKVILS